MIPREEPYVPPPKANLNRRLGELFARPVSVGDLYRLAILTEETVRFPDVSYYQGEINFDIMVTKTRAIIIRGGQGTWIDPQFKRNYAEAKRHGLKRGIYWFYDDRQSPKDQFEAVEKLLEEVGLPEMEIWVDWENTYKGKYGGLKNVVAFMQLIEERFPKAEVGMYTGFYWFVDNSNPILNYSQYQYLKNKPLWLASYTPDITKVRIPAPWTSMRIWQYGTPSIGEEMGVKSVEIDMNVYVDKMFTFDERYLEQEGETMSDYYRVTVAVGSRLQVRTGAGTNFEDVGDLFRDDVIEAKGPPVNGWMPILRAQRKDGSDARLQNDLMTIEQHGNCWCSNTYLARTTGLPRPVEPEPNPDPGPDPNKEISSIVVTNPESVTFNYRDGTSETK